MLRFLHAVLVAALTAASGMAGGVDSRIQAALVDEKCTDADVRALATKYPGLQDLHIGWPGMTDAVLKEAAKLTTVVALHIRNSSIYSRDGRVTRVSEPRISGFAPFSPRLHAPAIDPAVLAAARQ